MNCSNHTIRTVQNYNRKTNTTLSEQLKNITEKQIPLSEQFRNIIEKQIPLSEQFKNIIEKQIPHCQNSS
jgi:hypothetical protein